MKSLKGKLLIASPQLLDPNFARAVILIVSHDENGALGLILNRPLEVSLQQVLAQALEDDDLATAAGTLHGGGPCEGPLMLVHDDAERSQIEVMPGVHFTTDREDVEAMLRAADGRVLKFFVGYAGWSSDQLEGELEIGSWLQAPADAKQVFEPGLRQWQKWVTIITGELRVSPDKLPDDPSLN